MSTAIRSFHKIPAVVDAAEYTGDAANIGEILSWIREHNGLVFEAKELGWRHDFGAYHHKEHGFVYLPGGAPFPGSPIERLRDNELVVRAGNVFAVVFPGDFIVRSRHGFYPLRAESFHRSYQALHRRGTQPTSASPPV